MEKQTKHMAWIVFGAVAFYYALTHYTLLAAGLSRLCTIAMPAIVGGVAAFLLNVPMTGIEKRLKRLTHSSGKASGKGLRLVSLLLTFLCIIAVVAIAVLMLVPELSRSISSVAAQIQANIPGMLDFLAGMGLDTGTLEMQTEELERQLAAIDVQDLLTRVITGAGNVLGTLVDAVSATVSVVSTVVFALVIAMYILMDKENLSRQCKKLLFAYAKPAVAQKILHICTLVRDVFGHFLSGQFTECIVLGVLMFIALSIFRIPYASLIAVLTAVCAFIPYIGAFLSCAVGVILNLLVDPWKALLCLVVYQVVQFIENQFIYPRVVGSSVGLSPLWTIIAVLTGGEAFGIIGMVIFIPLTAVIYALLRESVNGRLEARVSANASEQESAAQSTSPDAETAK